MPNELGDLLDRLKLTVLTAGPKIDYMHQGPSREKMEALGREIFHDQFENGTAILKEPDGSFSVRARMPTRGRTDNVANRLLSTTGLAEGLTEHEAKSLVSLLAEDPKARLDFGDTLNTLYSPDTWEQMKGRADTEGKSFIADLINKGQAKFNPSSNPTELSPGSKLLEYNSRDDRQLYSNASKSLGSDAQAHSSLGSILDKGNIRSLLENSTFSDKPGLKFVADAGFVIGDSGGASPFGIPDVSTRSIGGDDVPMDFTNKVKKVPLMRRLFGDGLPAYAEPRLATATGLPTDQQFVANVTGGKLKDSFGDYSQVKGLTDKLVDLKDSKLRKAYVPSKLTGAAAGLYSNLRAALGDDVSDTEKAINGIGTLAATAPAIAHKARHASRTLDFIGRAGASIKNPKLKAIASVLPEAAVGTSGFLPMLFGGGDALEKKSSAVVPLAEIGGSIAGKELLRNASGSYIKNVFAGTDNPGNRTAEDKRLIRNLEDKWTGEEGGRFVTKDNLGEVVADMYGIDPSEVTRGDKINTLSQLAARGPLFMPLDKISGGKKTIYMPLEELGPGISPIGAYTKPGVLAHEMGHGTGWRPGLGWTVASNMGANIGGIGGFTAGVMASPWASDSTLGIIGGTGAAMSLPQLFEEARASWRGYNMLRDDGADFGTAIGAFGGFPTYLINPALALTPWAVRKLSNKVQESFDDKDEKKEEDGDGKEGEHEDKDGAKEDMSKKAMSLLDFIPKDDPISMGLSSVMDKNLLAKRVAFILSKGKDLAKDGKGKVSAGLKASSGIDALPAVSGRELPMELMYGM